MASSVPRKAREGAPIEKFEGGEQLMPSSFNKRTKADYGVQNTRLTGMDENASTADEC